MRVMALRDLCKDLVRLLVEDPSRYRCTADSTNRQDLLGRQLQIVLANGVQIVIAQGEMAHLHDKSEVPE